MRIRAFLVAATLSAFLAACGANPPKPTAEPPASPSASRTAIASADAPAANPVRPVATKRPASAPAQAKLTGDYAGYPAAQALVARLVEKEGFDRDYLYAVLSRAERQQWILGFLNRPKPTPSGRPTGSWTRYSTNFLNEDRIRKGLQFWSEYADVLDRAHASYGVPPEYVVAIIGVETHYGRNFGKHKVINALATLAFDYLERSEFFTNELEEYLVMTRNEGLDPFEPVGSYAGAMGIGQFMPSSFHRFAVDFNGDGKRDLWDPVDAIGSVANYFRGFDWRGGEAVAIPAKARGAAPQLLKADYTTSYRVDSLAKEGVTSALPLDGEGEVSLLRLDAAGGYEYWLGLHNFYVITRYNHSTYYAMAVHQLAQALRERRGHFDKPVISWLDRIIKGEGRLG